MIQYRILETGFFYADGGAMFGAIPKRAWSRKYPSDDQNCCLMAMRCLLVWNEERIVVLDTGVGNKGLGKLSYYRFFDLKSLAELVRSHGFEPEQVTDVVLSHLHFDHCGGCTFTDEKGDLQVTFPTARHWVSRNQWENYCAPNYLEQDSFRPEDMLPVVEAGLLQCVDEGFDLFDGFRIGLFDGHTTGQLVSMIETENGLCIYPSDVVPTKAHWSTDWISAYDTHPLDSVVSKLLLKEKTGEKEAFMIFYHDAYNKSAALHVRK